MKRLIILAAVAMTAAVHPQTEMSAEDAIAIGLENNYSIRIARNDARIAVNNAGLGTANFLPTLDASGGYSLATSEQTTNSPFSFGDTDSETLNGQVALNWTLFDGFRMFAEKGRFSALARLGEAQARSAIESAVVGILSNYFNLVRQELLLDVAREARAISETRLNKERVRNELGGASSTDLLNAQVAFNTDQAAVLDQELQVLVARNALNRALGRSPDAPLQVRKEIAVGEIGQPVDSLISVARVRNSDLEAARESLAAARRSVTTSRSAFLPRLALGASYAYTDRTQESNTRGEITTESTDRSVGLNLSINLFNGFRNRIEWQNARIAVRSRELALADGENRVEGLVRETFDTYRKRLELVQLEEQNVAAARRNLELQQDRYEIGAASSLDFRDAQVNYNRSQISRISARYQARVAQLQLEQLTGAIRIR